MSDVWIALDNRAYFKKKVKNPHGFLCILFQLYVECIQGHFNQNKEERYIIVNVYRAILILQYHDINVSISKHHYFIYYWKYIL